MKKIKRCFICNQPLSKLEIKYFKDICDKCRRKQLKKTLTNLIRNKMKKTKSIKPCPGSKIRSGGTGRGLGTGKRKGPICIPRKAKK